MRLNSVFVRQAKLRDAEKTVVELGSLYRIAI